MSGELNNQTQEDIERRERLKEWFKAEPEIWEDLAAEFNNAHRNENTILKARGSTGREWSAGFVSGLEFIIDLKRWIMKSWIATTPKTE